MDKRKRPLRSSNSPTGTYILAASTHLTAAKRRHGPWTPVDDSVPGDLAIQQQFIISNLGPILPHQGKTTVTDTICE